MEPIVNPQWSTPKKYVSNVSTLTNTLEMSSSLTMGANENNTKNLKYSTYKKMANSRYDIITEIPKPLNVLNEPIYAI